MWDIYIIEKISTCPVLYMYKILYYRSLERPINHILI